MVVAAVNCSTANNNNQVNQQMQRANQGRRPPPPASLLRGLSRQQRSASQHAESPSGPTRQSPRLEAQRQSQSQSSQNVHTGTPANALTSGQIAEQRRLQRQEQRGGRQVTDLETPAPRTRHRSPIGSANRGLREISNPQHASQGHQITRTSMGVTPTRERSNPAHGLRELHGTGTRQPAVNQPATSLTEQASGHRRAGSLALPVRQRNNPAHEMRRLSSTGTTRPAEEIHRSTGQAVNQPASSLVEQDSGHRRTRSGGLKRVFSKLKPNWKH